MQPPQKILIARGGAIGDFILTLPVFQALHARFPAAQLAVLTGRATGELAEHCGVVEESRNLDDASWASFFARDGQLDSEISDWLNTFDWIISYLHDADGAWGENVSRVTNARYVMGESNPGIVPGTHASARLLAALKPLGIADTESVARLKMPGRPRSTLCVAVHPGSGSEAKNWPEHNWNQFIRVLLDLNFKVCVIGGEAERNRLIRIRETFHLDCVRIIENRPLPEVAEAIAACSAFVGHDSGITHLASALGMKCIVLWADMDASVWRPLGEGVEILRDKNGIGSILPQDVKKILEKIIPIH